MKQIITRYAPSPTGYMHVGNLRTALYAFLTAKHSNGKFILRIEDTDKNREVSNAVDIIIETLKQTKLNYDEGPIVGGPNGPYVQSERKDIYLKYAQQLITEGKAYYCFCSKDELEKIAQEFGGYNGHCRNLSKEEIQKNLDNKIPYVIRHKARHEGTTTYHDHIFGEITVENSTLQDIVLIKSDGYPTYNFAHIIDDHLMGINFVLRGNEYITSTPQYVQIHEDLGWDLPEYYHLPLIMGKNEDGSVSKLSKRHGSVSFADLVEQGYLPQAIVNYIALLGWHPENSDQEIFSLEELIKIFNPNDIRKSSAIFDYDKLKWMNAKYIETMSIQDFKKIAMPYITSTLPNGVADVDKLCELLQPRVQVFSEIPQKIEFFAKLDNFDLELLENPKKKITKELSKEILSLSIEKLEKIDTKNWLNDNLYQVLEDVTTQLEAKAMAVMWAVRISLSGNPVTVGGATEIMQVLGKTESLNRLKNTLKRL